MDFDAFISYHHGADATVAAAIESGIERIARKWTRPREVSVFRDQSDLAAEPDLSGAITRTLDASRFLVLVASPESAASPWVDKEVAYWCDRHNGPERLIVVVTDGTFKWDQVAGALTSSTDAVSPAVRSRFTTEPLYVDLRWARSATELSLRDSRFRSAIVIIAATIRGQTPEELDGRDRELHRRALRLARTAVVTLVALTLVAAVAAGVAVRNARLAERHARQALGRQLELEALQLPASEVDQAFLLSLVAAHLDGGDDRFQASRALIGRYSRLESLMYAPAGTTSLRNIAISDDDVVAATTTQGDGTSVLLTWAAGTAEDPTVSSLPAAVGDAPSISFLDGGRLLIGAPSQPSGGSIVTTDTDGSDVSPFPRAVAVDTHSGTVAESTAAGGITLRDLGSGALLARASGPYVDLRFGRMTTASPDEIATFDVAGGTAAWASLRTGAFVTRIAAGPTAEVAAVSASYMGITPWSRSGGSLLEREPVALPAGVGEPGQLTVARDGGRVLVVGTAGSAVVDLVTGTATVDPGATGRVVVDASGRYAAVGGDRLTVWDLDDGQLRFAVPLPVTAMAWSECEAGERRPADGRTACRLVTAGESLDAWEPETRRRVELIDQTNAQSVAISSDGQTVVAAGWGSTVASWQLRPLVDDVGRSEVTEEEVAGALWGASGRGLDSDGPPCGSDPQPTAATSPSGTYMVSYSEDHDGTTTVCSADDGSVVATGVLGDDLVTEPVSAVAVDDAGDVAFGGGNGYVEHFLRDGATFATGHAVVVGSERVAVTSLAYRAGMIVAGLRPANEDAVARVLVWPVAGAGLPTYFDTDYREVPAIGLLGPDAGNVVVAERDSPDGPVTLQVWNTSTRWRLGRALEGLSGDVIALGGNETAVFAADASGMAYQWTLELDPTSDVCRIVGRPLAADEWDRLADGELRPYPPQDVCAGRATPPTGSITSTADS